MRGELNECKVYHITGLFFSRCIYCMRKQITVVVGQCRSGNFNIILYRWIIESIWKLYLRTLSRVTFHHCISVQFYLWWSCTCNKFNRYIRDECCGGVCVCCHDTVNQIWWNCTDTVLMKQTSWVFVWLIEQKQVLKRLFTVLHWVGDWYLTFSA